MGGSALSFRLVGGPALVARLAILGVMLAGLVLVAFLPPIWPLAVVAAALLAIVVMEGDGPAFQADDASGRGSRQVVS